MLVCDNIPCLRTFAELEAVNTEKGRDFFNDSHAPGDVRRDGKASQHAQELPSGGNSTQVHRNEDGSNTTDRPTNMDPSRLQQTESRPRGRKKEANEASGFAVTSVAQPTWKCTRPNMSGTS